jgi:hypothetical protein
MLPSHHTSLTWRASRVTCRVHPTEPEARNADPQYRYTERYGRYTTKYRTNSKEKQNETPIQSVRSGILVGTSGIPVNFPLLPMFFRSSLVLKKR